jgi:hypothetical protein
MDKPVIRQSLNLRFSPDFFCRSHERAHARSLVEL